MTSRNPFRCCYPEPGPFLIILAARLQLALERWSTDHVINLSHIPIKYYCIFYNYLLFPSWCIQCEQLHSTPINSLRPIITAYQNSMWCSRVAQWKRAGPITQRSVDRNHALLVILSAAGSVQTCLSAQAEFIETCINKRTFNFKDYFKKIMVILTKCSCQKFV